MKTYRFVGTESIVGNIKMTRFGQRFSIDEKLAEDAQKGGAALLLESAFLAIGFTSDELKVWADPFMSFYDVPGDPDDAKAKEEFLRKREVAQQEYCEIRQGLLSPHERHREEIKIHEAPQVVELPVPEGE